MIEWEDISTFAQDDTERIPSVYVHDIGSFRIVVHRHRDYDKDAWLCGCRELGIDMYELRNGNITDAQKEALRLVREKLRKYCKLIKLIDEEIGI